MMISEFQKTAAQAVPAAFHVLLLGRCECCADLASEQLKILTLFSVTKKGEKQYQSQLTLNSEFRILGKLNRKSFDHISSWHNLFEM